MSTNPENTHTSPSIGARDAQVKRYDAYPYYDGHQDLIKWELSEDGLWVKHSDFESVRQERDRLRAALEDITQRGPIMGRCDDFNSGQVYALTVCGKIARAALNQSDAQ